MLSRSSCLRKLKDFNNNLIIISSVKRYNSGESRPTPLYDLHVTNKGRMVSFAGFLLPVQYGNDGIATSHRHTRDHCSLFDVSHMLQTEVHGNDRVKFFESLCTTDIEGLADNSGALSLFTSNSGGIYDDLIVNKTSDGYLYIVSNASRRENDQSLMLKAQERFQAENKDVNVKFLEPEDRALIALQGPQSSAVLQPLVNVELSQVYFMNTRRATVAGVAGCRITRCGYTGEDGFEISIPARAATAVVEDILASNVAPVKLAGLGARDTLRLEAGLCLYGNDIDETTTPVSAGLTFTIGKRRRQTKDFPGAEIILSELKDKPQYKRVGLKSEGRGPPARQGAPITCEGEGVGKVTSGAPSPSLGYNIALGYVHSSVSQPGTRLGITVRDNTVPVTVSKLPFVPAKYYIKKKE
ncbi:aminomethyltransferase, mitochondrial-like isoform X1 [Macrosteles quadrilineatus]|uniref:aminomethyltransferase, mitochondrial-like isoform X1 n=2 Tax=Macrosteles quadrilineatus TaxID=74068 RepID=UPI0023E2E001|nr:aminomethyltransferase, mitochondrial-like isoform X1 [Macrosteles quadrilineatus]